MNHGLPAGEFRISELVRGTCGHDQPISVVWGWRGDARRRCTGLREAMPRREPRRERSASPQHKDACSGSQGKISVYAAAPSVVVTPPFGSFNTRYIWFDRDGADRWQETKGAKSGGTYYITIRYHAINAGLGTMIATINGNGVDTVNQEFLVGGTYYPGGLSFKGDMTQMQLFHGACYTGGTGGPVTVSNMCLTTSARATAGSMWTTWRRSSRACGPSRPGRFRSRKRWNYRPPWRPSRRVLQRPDLRAGGDRLTPSSW